MCYILLLYLNELHCMFNLVSYLYTILNTSVTILKILIPFRSHDRDVGRVARGGAGNNGTGCHGDGPGGVLAGAAVEVQFPAKPRHLLARGGTHAQ